MILLLQNLEFTGVSYSHTSVASIIAHEVVGIAVEPYEVVGI